MPNPNIDKYVVHTESNKNTLARKGHERENIQVIPHGAYDFFTDYDHENVNEEKNTILFFGNILPGKALEILVEAIVIASKEISDINLIIAGKGEIPDSAKTLIDSNKKNFEVRNEFIPNKEVGKYFNRAQVVVIPNREQKGHSGTLTVAYSFNKPVVTTSVGDFPELVSEKNTGLTVEPEDPRELSNAILKLLEDKELRSTMSSNTEEVVKELSWERVAEKHLEWYRS
jgi:glycosyltransferase involved in cell wall biosynthesis